MKQSSNVLNPTKPPINELMQLTALRIAAAIETLTEKGFTVIGIEFSSGSKPTIQIQSCSACAELIDKDEATYYLTGGSGARRYRTGTFKIGEVRIIWTEKGN
ncbi:hypothetical protein LIG30_1461 [Burkholderia sp. lig30]|jgi:hypothetical protein|uniref:hypothetical protein n=1 Tax=Burkholderia sp. lig30 TaxID=1192124 RepID=UPI00046112E6|nr:hypothetical protein [Burkholderia sp. lig30]KDB09489.1 hypothetical protein LIG30_1461 [Burkholderia sp. lig30]